MAMAGYVETRTRTFQASAALSKNRLVRLSAGKLAYATNASTDVLGTLARDTFAADEYVAVDLLNGEGTKLGVASGAIAVGAAVYGDANGKLTATASTNKKLGIALSAAAADGDFFEFLPHTTV